MERRGVKTRSHVPILIRRRLINNPVNAVPRFLCNGWLLSCFSVLSFSPLAAQVVTELPLLPESTVRIDGTSNKSDFSVEVADMTGKLWVVIAERGFEPDSVYFITKSGGLKSGKSSIMDRLMYKALKSTEYPDIVYQLGSSGVSDGGSKDGAQAIWNTSGTLELAGVVDTLAAAVSGVEESAGRFVFTGKHRMSMRDHGITPPTAMFGALHTSEWVMISFNLVFGEAETVDD
jgi:hypothetical protein